MLKTVFAFVVFLCISGSACRQKANDTVESQSLEKPFGELLYVGSGQCTKEITSDIAHTSQPKQFPREFVAGACYIFHVPASVNPELHIYLEEKLKSAGAKILKAPRSPKDFVFLIHGGPLFAITFRTSRNGALQWLQETQGSRSAELPIKDGDLVLRFDPS